MKDLLSYISVAENVCSDSRKVRKGSVFFAIRGEVADGRKFIPQAIANGASALVVDAPIEFAVPEELRVFRVEDCREALANTAASFFGEPAKELMTLGVTGTNGKSSVCWIVSEVLALSGAGCSQIGTLGWRDVKAGESVDFTLLSTTTPDSVWLQSFCRDALGRGIGAIAMEVSSHGLEQFRTARMDWNVAAFTNLTRDHLDYHGSTKEYSEAKAKLFFRELAASRKPGKSAVINIDDPFGSTLAKRVSDSLGDCRLVSVGQTQGADICLEEVSLDASGSVLTLLVDGQRFTFSSQLVGRYNAENLLVAAGMLYASGMSMEQVVELMPMVPSVPGRLELVPAKDVTVLIDYAHTPDALSAAQRAVKEITKGALITVFGCGGDRDRGKRPLMGRAVAELADRAIVTSDNPRTENPQQIIDDIIPGLKEVGAKQGFSWSCEVDRGRAIELALRQASPGDVVFIAGRGHEPFQTIGAQKISFLDAEVCRQTLSRLGLS